MISGVPTSTFDANGGYDSVYNLAKDYGSTSAPSNENILKYGPSVATSGVGNFSYAPDITQQGINNLASNGSIGSLGSIFNAPNYYDSVAQQFPTQAAAYQQTAGYNPSQGISGSNNLSSMFQPYMDQIKQLQTSLSNMQSGTSQSPTAGYTSGSYTNPNNLAGLYPTKSVNLNNSRGARYFNQDSNSYQTGDTGTDMASF